MLSSLCERHSYSNSFKLNFIWKAMALVPFLLYIFLVYLFSTLPSHHWQCTIKLCESLLFFHIPYNEALRISTYIFLNQSQSCVRVVASARLSCLLDYTVVVPIFSQAHIEERKFSNTSISLDITMQSPWNQIIQETEVIREKEIFFFLCLLSPLSLTGT